MTLLNVIENKIFRLGDQEIALLKHFRKTPSFSVKLRLLLVYQLVDVYRLIEDRQEFERDGFEGTKDWHKTFGQADALHRLIRWLGFENGKVIEGSGEHWADYAVELDRRPTERDIYAVIGLCQKVAPARSRLTRIYLKSNNIRRLTISTSNGQLSKNILSNDSGKLKNGVWIAL